MKFVLEIRMGNEAMQTDHDVANKLREIGNFLLGRNLTEEVGRLFEVWDENGNCVGHFSFQEEVE